MNGLIRQFMKDIISIVIIMVFCIVALFLRNTNEDTVAQHNPDPKKAALALKERSIKKQTEQDDTGMFNRDAGEKSNVLQE